MTSIAHASIPADNPQRVAEILADIFQGEALPFPPAGKDAWMAWSSDGQVEIEISKRGLVMTYCDTQAEWMPDGISRRLSETHLAICVERPKDEIVAIANNAGWPVRICDRGDGVFAVGDVRCGSVKRVAAAVGEGSTVVSALHAWLARQRAALAAAAQ